MHSVQRKQSNYILHYKSRIPQLCQMSDKFGKIHSKKFKLHPVRHPDNSLSKGHPTVPCGLCPLYPPFSFIRSSLALLFLLFSGILTLVSYVVRQISFDQRTVHHKALFLSVLCTKPHSGVDGSAGRVGLQFFPIQSDLA